MPHWCITKDGDLTCLALFHRHYSHRKYADGRKPKLFCGPGEKMVLRTAAGNAFFVWRKFRDDCIDQRTGERQRGINCAVWFIKWVGTYNKRERKVRLFRIVWSRKGGPRAETPGKGWTAKLSFNLVPKLFSFSRDDFDLRVAVLGMQVHKQRHWGGWIS